MMDILDKLYSVRYSKEAEKRKGEIWRILCRDFLQKFVDNNDTVLDIAAGHCEFINNISCKQKYALDIDERIKKYAYKDVKVYICSATSMPKELRGKIDLAFMGCLLEHLSSKDEIIQVLLQTKKVLKKDGKLMILNPNIRFSTSDYWDYFDHLTPISDRSVVEALKALSFDIEVCIPRFVPNTIKDRLPKSPLLVKLYLRMPFLFPVFGKQMFIVARKLL